MNAYLILGAIVFLSSYVLWCRYREGHLLTPSNGLHLQILIFYGMGGFAFLLFPDSEPRLAKQEIIESVEKYCLPLLIGYGISVLVERRYFRKPRQVEMIMSRFAQIPPFVVAFFACLGFAGFMMEGKFRGSGFDSISTYFRNLFFPCLLFAMINTRKPSLPGRLVAAIFVSMALIIAVWSPWRSTLILLTATVFLALIFIKPRLIPATIIGGVFAMGFLIPFQLAKRRDYKSFMANPMVAFQKSLDMGFTERWRDIGDFVAKRINYTRELTYVNRALDAGYEPQHGKTYLNVIYQMVPRMLWPAKPQMAYWAGYDLPREVGLLQTVDTVTSWAVNMFAEATYNYRIWCLVWFVPAAILFAEFLEKLVKRFSHTRQAIVLGNVAFFYLFLSITTVIFGATMTIGLFLVVKASDLFIVKFAIPSMNDRRTKARPRPPGKVRLNENRNPGRTEKA